MGLAFGAHFEHAFSINMFLASNSINWQVSTTCFKFLFSQLIAPKLSDLSSIIFSSNSRLKEREDKKEIQKCEYLENEKSFLDEIKSTCYNF